MSEEQAKTIAAMRENLTKIYDSYYDEGISNVPLHMAAIAEKSLALAPDDGMVLVPREPTEAMLTAPEHFDGSDKDRDAIRKVYRAMIGETEG